MFLFGFPSVSIFDEVKGKKNRCNCVNLRKDSLEMLNIE